MKVLHTAYTSVENIGILHQMEDEQKSALALELPWKSVVFGPSKIESPVLIPTQKASSLRMKYNYFRWLSSQKDLYDVILLRHTPYDPAEWIFLLTCKKPVWTVHHTLEIPEILLASGFTRLVKSSLELLGRPLIKAFRRGVVSVTHEIGRYQAKDYLLYPNGIMFDDEPLILDTSAPTKASDIHLLFVASYFYSWHGLEHLIANTKIDPTPCHIHLVGDIPQTLQNDISADPRFIYHGRLSTLDIQILASQCTLGLSSFNLEIMKIKEACPLKVREYLKAGLPVYGGYKEVLPVDFPYYRQGPAKLSEILRFAKEMQRIPRHQISIESRPHIDKKPLLKTLYTALQGQYGTATE
jgi:hypothetical protein